MTILELFRRARRYPIFSLEDCRKWFPATTRETLMVQLSHAVRRGHIVRLKRGLYLLHEEPFPDSRVIASRLDPRAIVSLEAVLHSHGIIPEVPFATTAVTPGKTAQYRIAPFGQFVFRHVKPDLVFGATIVALPPYRVSVAEPEKALLDLFWFHRFERNPKGYIQELRLSLPRTFKRTRFLQYARAYRSIELLKIARLVLDHA